jgi:hypothetical protein
MWYRPKLITCQKLFVLTTNTKFRRNLVSSFTYVHEIWGNLPITDLHAAGSLHRTPKDFLKTKLLLFIKICISMISLYVALFLNLFLFKPLRAYFNSIGSFLLTVTGRYLKMAAKPQLLLSIIWQDIGTLMIKYFYIFFRIYSRTIHINM